MGSLEAEDAEAIGAAGIWQEESLGGGKLGGTSMEVIDECSE